MIAQTNGSSSARIRAFEDLGALGCVLRVYSGQARLRCVPDNVAINK
jgi:hypothetical protein